MFKNVLDCSKMFRNLIKDKILLNLLLLYLHCMSLSRALVLEDSKHETIDPQIKCKDSTCDQITIRFKAFGDLFDVLLSVKRDLFSDKLFEGTQDSVQRSFPKNGEVGECRYFSGSGRYWAAISVCHHKKVTGVLTKDGNAFHINFNGKRSEHHIFRDNDLPTEPGASCSVNGVTPSAEDELLSPSNDSNPKSNEHKYLELLVVIDNTFYREAGSDSKLVKQFAKDALNLINEGYKKVNLNVVLMGLIVWETRDEIILSPNDMVFLQRFTDYSVSTLFPKYHYDSCHLWSGNDFTGGVGRIGLAWLGEVCRPKSVGIDYRPKGKLASRFGFTVLHEMGHNLGMHHDAVGCQCPARCYMAEDVSPIMPTEWSSCSLDFFRKPSTEKALKLCLLNRPTGPPLPSCGNGLVEAGEQCDCPVNDSQCPLCCETSTCRLKPRSSCSSGPCCQNCHPVPKSQTKECRKKQSECDVSEHCEGGPSCPTDSLEPDGLICDQNTGHCYKGSCKSRGSLCKLLLGPLAGDGFSRCYNELNGKGNREGHCGHIFSPRRGFKPCPPQDVFCGLVHCTGITNLEIDVSRADTLGINYSIFNKTLGTNYPSQGCVSLLFEIKSENVADPFLAWDRTKCGLKNWCINGKCVLNTEVPPKCPGDCYGHGKCENGICRCSADYLPPDCRQTDTTLTTTIGSTTKREEHGTGTGKGGRESTSYGSIVMGLLLVLILVIGTSAAVYILAFRFKAGDSQPSSGKTLVKSKT